MGGACRPNSVLLEWFEQSEYGSLADEIRCLAEVPSILFAAVTSQQSYVCLYTSIQYWEILGWTMATVSARYSKEQGWRGISGCWEWAEIVLRWQESLHSGENNPCTSGSKGMETSLNRNKSPLVPNTRGVQKGSCSHHISWMFTSRTSDELKMVARALLDQNMTGLVKKKAWHGSLLKPAMESSPQITDSFVWRWLCPAFAQFAAKSLLVWTASCYQWLIRDRL